MEMEQRLFWYPRACTESHGCGWQKATPVGRACMAYDRIYVVSVAEGSDVKPTRPHLASCSPFDPCVCLPLHRHLAQRPPLLMHVVPPANPALPHPWSTLAEGSSSGFRYFWITDSCPTADAVCTAGEAPVQPFEVLSLAQPIAAALQI